MNQALNDPLAHCALSEIKFNRIDDLEQYLPEIQEQMHNAGFSEHEQTRRIDLKVSTDDNHQPEIHREQRTQWIFHNSDRTEVYCLVDDAITFYTTRQMNSDDFLLTLLSGMLYIRDVANLEYTTRTGLRYLNAFATASGMRSTNRSPQNFFKEARSENHDGTLVTRYFTSNNGLIIPPDLAHLDMAFPDGDPSRVGKSLVLDTDYFATCTRQFDLLGVYERLQDSHSNLMKSLHSLAEDVDSLMWKSEEANLFANSDLRLDNSIEDAEKAAPPSMNGMYDVIFAGTAGSPHIQPLVKRAEQNPKPHEAETRPVTADQLSAADQIFFIQQNLSLNIAQLAVLFNVTRPTVYAWVAGKQPRADKFARIRFASRIAMSLQSLSPLKMKSLMHRPVFESRSLFDKMVQGDVSESDIQTIKSLHEKNLKALRTPKGLGKNRRSNDLTFRYFSSPASFQG